MATADETPIWEVIEEFKEKVKSQESELKKRREKIDTLETSLNKQMLDLEEQAKRLDQREKELKGRLAELEPREAAVQDKETRVKVQEKEVHRREEEVHRSRVELERRQVEVTKREENITLLAERSAGYEKDIHGMNGRIREMEAALIQDQERTRQILDDLSSLREGLLAKGKVLADQEALLAEGRRIVLDEQKRFVSWEKALNEREESLTRRSAIPAPVLEGEPAEEIESEPVRAELAPETGPVEAPEEPLPEPIKAPEPAPVIEEEEAPTPVIRAQGAKPSEDDEPETPVFRSEEKPAGPTCPECRKPVSEDDEKCPHCGHVLKEAPKHVEEAERKEEPKDEGRDDGPKKAVSIRKIIRRK